MSPYDREKQLALNHQHRVTPEPGDYWEERRVGQAIVLAVTANTVVICRSKYFVTRNYWAWDLPKTELMTRLEFSLLFTYKVANEELSGLTWADVHPRAYSSLAEKWLDNRQ